MSQKTIISRVVRVKWVFIASPPRCLYTLEQNVFSHFFSHCNHGATVIDSKTVIISSEMMTYKNLNQDISKPFIRRLFFPLHISSATTSSTIATQLFRSPILDDRYDCINKECVAIHPDNRTNHAARPLVMAETSTEYKLAHGVLMIEQSLRRLRRSVGH